MTAAASPNQSSGVSTDVTVALPRYQLISRLATGGMAEVFLAIAPSDLGPAKPVVIKRLWPELARDAECVQMFLAEVRLSLRLNHPNVIHAYESGHDGDRHFLVMEYLDGQALKHILDKFNSRPNATALSLPLALKIVSDVLAGLHYVHSLADLDGTPLQIVHRDVSPQNVFVTCDGTVKLIDFGIAQTVQTLDHRQGRARDAKGRAAYMAPEQAAGNVVDQRADLFSVGIMLWEMAVGRRLWQGQTDAEIRGRLLAGETLPNLPKSHGFPPGLAAVCRRALAVDPKDRYQSAVEFQAELAELITGSMPVQSRLLGEMVSRGFASSRALSRSMIQQSLPGPRSSGASSSQDLPKQVASSAASQEMLPHQPSSHSSTYTIAAAHDDITQVSPQPKLDLRPRLIPRWFFVTVGVAVIALVAMPLSRRLPRHVSSPEPAPVAPSKTVTAEPARTATPTMSAEPLPVVVMPAQPQHTAMVASKPTKRASTARTVTQHLQATAPAARPSSGESQLVPSRSPDFFEVAKAKAAQPLLHSIDREDPYAR